MPTQDDFPRQHPDNNIFIEKIKVCILFGKVIEARQHPQLNDDTFQHIKEELKSWFDRLPSELSRHPDQQQRPYRRVVCELHILYLSCMIFCLQSLINVEKNAEKSRASIQECVHASSEISKLFEEVLCRNDVLYLSTINNWFCQLAAVTHIRARSVLSPEQLHPDGVEIFKRVLRGMVAIVPSSALILRNIEHLELQTGDTGQGETPTRREVSSLQPPDGWEARQGGLSSQPFCPIYDDLDRRSITADMHTGDDTFALVGWDAWGFDDISGVGAAGFDGSLLEDFDPVNLGGCD